MYLLYHLRLIHALIPFLSTQYTQTKLHKSSGNTGEKVDDKTLERLFRLLPFCEEMVKNAPYPELETYENEDISINSLCDKDVSEESIDYY